MGESATQQRCLSAQESFAREHPWYFVHRLEAVSQFPTPEVPGETARVIIEFVP